MLELRNVKARLGSFELRVPHLRLEDGKYYAVIGRSGVGKTALLWTIAGLTKVTEGRVLLNGEDVTHLEPERRGFALLPQHYALFPHMTIYENIAFPLKVRGEGKERIDEEVKRIAQDLGIKHLLNRKPNTLSGGEKQRAALARALIINPKALLLDEPLSNLDPELRTEGRKLLKKIKKEKPITTLHVTHSIIDVAELADTVIHVDKGTIKETQPTNSFLKTQTAKKYLQEYEALMKHLKTT